MTDTPVVWVCTGGGFVGLEAWRASSRPELWALVCYDGLGGDYAERPRWAFHVPPFARDKYRAKRPEHASLDGGLHAYGFPLSSEGSGEARAMRELYAPQLDVDATGILWLAPAHLGSDWLRREAASYARRAGVVLVDLGKCDPDRLRDTGQAEGNVVHAGPVPARALVAADSWPHELRDLGAG